MDLLVIAFSPNEGHLLLKSLSADLVLVEKVNYWSLVVITLCCEDTVLS